MAQSLLRPHLYRVGFYYFTSLTLSLLRFILLVWSRSQSTSTTSSIIPREEPGGLKPPFTDLKGIIHHNTLKAITVRPFKMTTMTAVQAAVLPLLPELINPHNPNPAEGDPPPAARDLLVKARTGTGKTLAFLVPAIEARLNAIEQAGKVAVRNAGLAADKHLASRTRRLFSRTEVGTLIISPTRELATQIANEALRLAHHHDNFEVRLFTGGTSKRLQMRDWMKGYRDIVVATPGRLLDCLQSEPEVKNGISKTQIVSFHSVLPIVRSFDFLFSSSSTKLIHYWTWVSETILRPSNSFCRQHHSVRPFYSLPLFRVRSSKLLARFWTRTIYLSTQFLTKSPRCMPMSPSTTQFCLRPQSRFRTLCDLSLTTNCPTQENPRLFSSLPQRS